MQNSAHRSNGYDGRTAGNEPILLCVGDTSKHDCSRFGYTPEKLERGRQVLAAWRVWLASNPIAWRMGVAHLWALASEGKRISAQMLCEYIREHDFTDHNGNPTKLDNSFAPIISRKLVKECPDLASHFEFRRSVFDVLGWY